MIGFGFQSETRAHIGLCKNHAAALPATMVIMVEPIRAPIGNHRVSQDVFVGNVIETFQLLQQRAQRRILSIADILIVISDDFDADGIIVDSALPLPHAASRVFGNLCFIDDPIHSA